MSDCCCGGSSSSSGSQSLSGSSSGGNITDPCANSACWSNSTYSFTLSGVNLNINGCTDCSAFNATWTLSHFYNGVCGALCAWGKGYFTACSVSGTHYDWRLVISLFLGVYTYSLYVEQACGSVTGCLYQGTSNSCSGATLFQVGGGNCPLGIACTLPTSITIATP